jgi:hypothetical protein
MPELELLHDCFADVDPTNRLASRVCLFEYILLCT